MIASTLRRFEGFAPVSRPSLRRDVLDRPATRETALDRTTAGLGITLRGLSKSFDGGRR